MVGFKCCASCECIQSGSDRIRRLAFNSTLEEDFSTPTRPHPTIVPTLFVKSSPIKENADSFHFNRNSSAYYWEIYGLLLYKKIYLINVLMFQYLFQHYLFLQMLVCLISIDKMDGETVIFPHPLIMTKNK